MSDRNTHAGVDLAARALVAAFVIGVQALEASNTARERIRATRKRLATRTHSHPQRFGWDSLGSDSLEHRSPVRVRPVAPVDVFATTAGDSWPVCSAPGSLGVHVGSAGECVLCGSRFES